MASAIAARGNRDVREEILEAAARVFTQVGFRGASLRDIASEAGFTTGAIYSNFRGKPDVLLTLFERHNQRLAAEITTAAIAEQDPERQLARAAERWMRFLREEPAWYELLIEFWVLAVRDPELRVQYAQRFRAVRSAIGSLIEERAREQGLDMTLSGEELGSTAIGLADGLALQRLADADAIPDDLLARLLVSLLESIAKPKSA